MIDVAKYGPWAVIAGGSEGVGAEFAVQLARAGLNLVLIAQTGAARGDRGTLPRNRRRGSRGVR